MSSAQSSTDRLAARRRRIRESKEVFGVDFVEICRVHGSDPAQPRVRLHLLGLKPPALDEQNLTLRRVGCAHPLPIRVVEPEHGPHAPTVIELDVLGRVEPLGEYELVVSYAKERESLVDPFFDRAIFRFEKQVNATVDCKREPIASRPVGAAPEINYLAKDYASFRQLLLDRLSVTLPEWQERSPADIGVMLVEILAYAADHLSYYQDAVATEAYLGTARFRQSLRRHARLVDYRIHEGCNARAWVHIDVDDRLDLANAWDLFFVSLGSATRRSSSCHLSASRLDDLLQTTSGLQVFEPVVSRAFTFWPSHNECIIYDWNGAEPCLKRGATRCCLVDRPATELPAYVRNNEARPWIRLKVGDVVCFEEIRDPWSGSEHDGNPQHRHVVRITEVIADRRDPLFGVPLVEIAWDEADALPFTLWVVKPPDAAWETEDNFPVTVARGNMLLVDHGRRNQSALKLKPSHGRPPAALDRDYPAPRIRSELPETDLTFADTLPDSGAPAASQLRQDPRRATPHLILRERSNEQDVLSAFSFHELRDLRRVAKRLLDALVREAAPWASNALPRAARCQFHVGNACGGCDDAELQQALRGMKRLRDAIKDDLRAFWLPQYDLMNSGPADSHFVVEMSDERVARLRFGQGGFGRVPYVHDDPHQPEMTAFYRVGNGTAGNVGAEAICLVGSHGQSIEQITNVRNPLSAVGGVDPESPRQIRLFAPHAVRADLRRAVTAGDYVQIVMRDFGEKLQSAKASARWTGHEVEILIAVDPRGSETPDPQLLRSIQAALRKYKRIGHNVSVRAAERVVPTLQLSVCLEPRTLRETARGRMNALFSNRVQSDGSLGFFHPDRLSFGNGVFVSQIVAAQLRVPGVVHMEVTQLHRSDQGPADELETGVLPLRALEIVRFDNDPGHPERGVLDLILEGGR